jgi:hypothetical protein
MSMRRRDFIPLLCGAAARRTPLGNLHWVEDAAPQ